MELFWQCSTVICFGAMVLAVTLWRLEAMNRHDEHTRAEEYRRKWLQSLGAEQYADCEPVHLYPRRRGR